MPTKILSQNQDELNLYNAISSFFTRFGIGKLLSKCNANKEKGVHVFIKSRIVIDYIMKLIICVMKKVQSYHYSALRFLTLRKSIMITLLKMECHMLMWR